MSRFEIQDPEGHITVWTDEGRTTHIDMGDVLQVTTSYVTPDEARELGHALIAWSAWRRNVIDSPHYWRDKEYAK